jgi:streptogramin lyase
VTGCGARPDAEPPRPTEAEREAFREAWAASPAPAPERPQSVAVARGRAPLAYIAQQDGSVWLSDDAGRQWGPVEVEAQSVVRVAEATGVKVGSVVLDRGPMQPGRIYTIHVGVPRDRGWRHQVQQGPVPSAGQR